MTGGVASVVHRLTIDHGTHRSTVVLRQYEHADSCSAVLIRHEAATLGAVRAAGLPAPELIAADADGRESDGRPAILMTRLPGRLDLTPADPDRWLSEIAATAAQIHAAQVAAGPFQGRIDAASPVIPASATRPSVWRAAFNILGQDPPAPAHPPASAQLWRAPRWGRKAS